MRVVQAAWPGYKTQSVQENPQVNAALSGGTISRLRRLNLNILDGSLYVGFLICVICVICG